MSDDLRKFKRNLSAARREIRKAVERGAATDLRPGHYAEARRLAQQIRDEADALVRRLGERS